MTNLLPPYSGQPPTPYSRDPHGAEHPSDARAAWQTVFRNWHIILGCLVLGVAAGWLYTSRVTPIYRGATTLRIEEEEGKLPALDALKDLQGDSRNQVSTEMEVMRSRALADDVVRSLNLRLQLVEPRRVPRSRIVSAAEIADTTTSGVYRFERGPNGGFTVFREGEQLPLEQVGAGSPVHLGGAVVHLNRSAAKYPEFTLAVTSPREAIDSVQRNLTVMRPNREASVVAVTFRHPDPELARDVPNVLAERFISRRVEVRKTGARSTVDFLRGQLDTLRTQLQGSEDKLRQFRESNQVVSLEAEGTAQVSHLAELQAKRTELNAERTAMERVVEEARAAPRAAGDPSPYRRLLAFPTLLQNQLATSLLASISKLETDRALLLRRRTAEDPEVQNLSRAIQEQEAQVEGVVLTYLEGLRQQVNALDSSLVGFGKRLEKIPAKEVQFARLQRNITVLGDISTLLQTRLKESEIARAVGDASAQIVDRAYLPVRPVVPREGVNLFFATLLGLALGLGVAFGRNWLDRAVHTGEEVRLITGVPLLGLIPHIANGKGRFRLSLKSRRRVGHGPSHALVASRDPHNMVSEAYRALRTNLAFVRPDSPAKSIVFTSPRPEDGKTTSVANLAASLAQQDMRVLVIDADLRRGILHRLLGARRKPGLSDLLVGTVKLGDAIQTVDVGGDARVSIIGSGLLPPNPAELLGSGRMKDLLQQLEPLYDAILIDCAPLNLFTDAAVAGTQADGVLLVARAGKTQGGELAYSMDQLRNVRVPVLGVVLNDFDFKRDGGYSGAYYYAAGYSYGARNGG
jgi:polysaccharide biosynthesis transport protein